MRVSKGLNESTLYFNLLGKKQCAMLPKLGFLRKEYSFYLGGGTALALQMGHRRSIDFDFYTRRDFDPHLLQRRLKRVFKMMTITHLGEGTLNVAVQNTEMSFFKYDYPLLKPLVKTKHLDLLDPEDIAAMKIIAIAQRGTRRDFLDIYYLLKKYTLKKLLGRTEKKYDGFNRYIALRALTYFDDAEEDRSRSALSTVEKISWDKIKREIIKAVDQYGREDLTRSRWQRR